MQGSHLALIKGVLLGIIVGLRGEATSGEGGDGLRHLAQVKQADGRGRREPMLDVPANEFIDQPRLCVMQHRAAH
jgi:hypothetical protein